METISYTRSAGCQVLSPVFRSIGIYVFASPPPLMLPLGALLLLAVVIAGHARSSAMLAFRDRQASCADQNGPVPVLIVLEGPS